MNVLLWVLQLALAFLYLSGGGYKTFNFAELSADLSAMPPIGWQVLGVFEMLGGVLLIVPAAINRKTILTPIAAAALAVETFALAAFYAAYSTASGVENPMYWALVMGVLVAFVAWGRFRASAPAASKRA